MKLPYRANVCGLVVNSENRVFLGSRRQDPSVWQFPQGGIDENELPEMAIIREIHEELGVDPSLLSILKRLKTTHRYDFEQVPDYAVGLWRGQHQTFWLLRFSGSDSQIQLDRFTPEFVDWKWCALECVRELAEPRRMVGYEPALVEAMQFLGLP